MSDTPKATDGFQLFTNQRSGIPTIIKYNSPGTQLAIALSDHRIRVYGQSTSNDQKWNLVDQWRGHDAEIFEMQWIDCVHGEFLASIGGDNKYKLWQEAPSFSRGHRFRCVYSQSSQDHVFYVAMDHLCRNQDIYVGLVSQTGLLSLLEPSDPDSISSWREIDALYPFGQMQRSVEPCFGLSFQRSVSLNVGENAVEVDSTSIVFAVSCRQHVKIYCSSKADDEGLVLQEVCTLPFPGSMIRGIAWANGTALLGNLIAILFDAGNIKLLDVKYEKSSEGTRDYPYGNGSSKGATSAVQPVVSSGISAGLAGLARSNSVDIPEPQMEESALRASAKEIGNLSGGSGGSGNQMTGMTWVQAGAMLASMCRNGTVSMWRPCTTGEWMKYAESAFV